jgi:hypothetical protein
MRFTVVAVIVLFPIVCFFSCKKVEKITSLEKTEIIVQDSEFIVDQIGPYELIMPTSVPDVVNDYVIKVAKDKDVNNFRILQVKNEPMTYNLLCYSEEKNSQYAFNLKLNSSQNELKEIIVIPIDNNKLKKTNTWTCWNLVAIFPYLHFGGDSYLFTQSTTTYGWYHKTIKSLVRNLGDWGCCSGMPLTSDYNDHVNSFDWYDNGPNTDGRIARPAALHLFENENYSGIDQLFEVDPQYNSSTPLCRLQYTTVGKVQDKVTSLDIFYRVFTPTN